MPEPVPHTDSNIGAKNLKVILEIERTKVFKKEAMLSFITLIDTLQRLFMWKHQGRQFICYLEYLYCCFSFLYFWVGEQNRVSNSHSWFRVGYAYSGYGSGILPGGVTRILECA